MATTIYLTNNASDLDLGANEELEARVEVRGGLLSTGTTDTSTFGERLTRDTTSDIDIVWYTPPLDGVTIAGTITFNVWMAESNMSANVDARINIYRVNNDGSGETAILLSAKGTEVPLTTRAAQNWTGAPTSTVISAGQRLKFEVWGGDTLNQAAGFTFNASWASPLGGIDGDTFVTFTETITEQAAGPAANPPYRNPMPPLIAQ